MTRACWRSTLSSLTKTRLMVYLAAAVLLTPAARAQQSSAKDAKPKDQGTKLEDVENPVMWGEYQIHSTIDIGGVIDDFSGSSLTYQTLVNQRDGFRILEQSLDMFAPKHDGFLFNELHFSNSGYFGEPNSWTRLSF